MKTLTLWLSGLLLASLPLKAETIVVPVAEEARHIQVFDNDWVQVYEVRLAPGEGTDFHIHSVDQLTLVLTASEGVTQVLGEQAVTQSAPKGTLIYSPYSTVGPFTHRVMSGQTSALHVLGIALKGDSGGADRERMSLPDQQQFAFPQGNARRLTLAQGESRTLSPGLVVALGEGQLTQASQSRDLRSGELWWLSEASTVTNGTESPMPLIVVTFLP
ncbi:hypothetical protein [Ferrimonas gelatinilytica]|uniref:Cupin domain-containing protein n=1 Tax=Ferrimonas gelatinilytica TaxID=1255257 RepID=A0ABP9SAU6_9GAMM